MLIQTVNYFRFMNVASTWLLLRECPKTHSNHELDTFETTVELQKDDTLRHTAASSHAIRLSTWSTTEHSSWPVIQGEAVCFLPERSGILQDECFPRERGNFCVDPQTQCHLRRVWLLRTSRLVRALSTEQLSDEGHLSCSSVVKLM